MSAETFRALREYSRVVETQVITELGIYKKDETPEDYGGYQLEVEVIHIVFMYDKLGQVQKLVFEIEEALDKDDKVGGPINLDGVEIKEGDGGDASSVPTELTTKKKDMSDTDTYPENLVQRIELLIERYNNV